MSDKTFKLYDSLAELTINYQDDLLAKRDATIAEMRELLRKSVTCCYKSCPDLYSEIRDYLKAN